jgi:hypothetical protein
MGILNSTYVTVDAILTKKGRQMLAQGNFNITQFALSDDEIDYTLYNPNHPSGSAFYGESIELTPVIEAFPDDSQLMRYKLFTASRSTTTKLPVISNINSTYTFKLSESKTIQPSTLNFTNNIESGYVITIGDSRLFSVVSDMANSSQTPNATIGTRISTSISGTKFTIKATDSTALFGTATTVSTTMEVMGKDSGARYNAVLTISKS